MKRASLVTVAALALFVGWTSTSTSEWFKGIIYAGSGKIQLTDATGNLVPQGNLTASGNVGIGGTLAVTGATTLRSTLAVSGAQTNAGALGVSGALGVTGAATLRSTLSVTGATTLAGALSAPTGTFSGPVTLASDLSLTEIADGLTAGTGGQATGTAITATLSRFTVVTTSNDATLPAAVAGLCLLVGNADSADALDVFPASGDQINIITTNNAMTLAAGEAAWCCAVNTTNWMCVIGSAT